MTDETKPTPQRLQPRSTSPMADQVRPQAAKRPPGRPAKQEAKPGPTRQPLTAPTQNQLEAMRPPEDRAPEAAEAEPARDRSSRVPFGTREAKLAVPEREGFTRRWFNDEPGRIARALRAGYVHVNDEITGKPMERVVTKGTDRAGGMTAFCLEIPNEFYDEDFAAKQEALDIIDMQIYTGKHNEQPGDARYVPSDTMKMRSGHARRR